MMDPQSAVIGNSAPRDDGTGRAVRTIGRSGRLRWPPMGWVPDAPDWRDYTDDHPEVQPILGQIGASEVGSRVPASIDLRPFFPPVDDQRPLASCTASAVAALSGYFERRAFANNIELSRQFLYKATRNLLGWSGDTGAPLRHTLGAVNLFGLPPEENWPFDEATWDVEPPAYLYTLAASYKAFTYWRLDPAGSSGEEIINRARVYLAAGLPLVFGLTLYTSISQSSSSGEISFPAPSDRVVGTHCLVAVGYEDVAGSQVKGAFLVRNSWGDDWGQFGYGVLPYEYILRGIAVDWWAATRVAWINTGQFGL